MSKHTNDKNTDERTMHGVEASDVRGSDGGSASEVRASDVGSASGLRLGVDIGGTHITAALVRDGVLLPETLRRVAIDPTEDAGTLLDDWASLMNAVLSLAAGIVKEGGKAKGDETGGDGAGASAVSDDGGKATGGATNEGAVKSIGLAMPGPFDYPNGISMIAGLDKYESLYGLNIREGLRNRLTEKDLPICFENDAACFGLGEARTGRARGHKKIIAITLGTGLGACFMR